MYKTLGDIKVKLLNANEIKMFPPEQIIGEFASICHRGIDLSPKICENISKDCIDKGHGSAIRIAKFRFQVLNIDMATGEQMTRSVVGTDVQKDQVKINKISRRYTELLSDDLFIPNNILNSKYKDKYIELHKQAYGLYINMLKDKEENIKEEDARMINLWGSTTGLNIEYSFEALKKVCADRLCLRTQLPYRTVVTKMVEEIKKVSPFISKYLVPKCKDLGYCPEEIGCRALKKSEAKTLLEKAYKEKRCNI